MQKDMMGNSYEGGYKVIAYLVLTLWGFFYLFMQLDKCIKIGLIVKL